MTPELKENYLKMVDSLRRHQRAELINDENENIIEYLYADPIEGNFVLNTMLLPQSTILIGRKGTGKSTIIGRFQHEVRKSKDRISLYLDVKTIYEQSTGTAPQAKSNDTSLSSEEFQKYQLYKHFLGNALSEIEKEINKNVFTNRFKKFFSNSGLTELEFKEEINKLFKELNSSKYEDITALKTIKHAESKEESTSEGDNKEFVAKFKPELKVDQNKANLSAGKLGFTKSKSLEHKDKNITNDEYSTVLIRYFNVFEFIDKIKRLLEKLEIKLVFLCLDDASELEKEALDIFIRTLIVPFNNSSNGFFKFKISFYPGRDHLPNIDRTKLETINLDYYYLYQSAGVDKIEENAVNYTKRLLETRIAYYLGESFSLDEIFDLKNLSMGEYYKVIFQATANVTRLIGKILWYAGKRSITQSEKINKRTLQEAAREHYEQEIEVILSKNEYMQYKNYSEKFEREHLKKLLEKIVSKAKENKKHIGTSTSEIFKLYNTNTAPSNYLYFPPNLENVLATLELNFFISKYSQQKDRGSYTGSKYIPPKEISIYTLNYGLCQKESIIVDEGSDRKFRIERVFDYFNLIYDWANNSKIIRCTHCGAIYSIDKLEAIKQYDMLCQKCLNKTCKVESVETNIEEEVPVTIREIYFQVLNTLKIEDGLSSPEIAQELDVSYQSINQRIRHDRFLAQSNYINKKEIEGVNRYFITTNALKIFFSNSDE